MYTGTKATNSEKSVKRDRAVKKKTKKTKLDEGMCGVGNILKNLLLRVQLGRAGNILKRIFFWGCVQRDKFGNVLTLQRGVCKGAELETCLQNIFSGGARGKRL